MIDFITKELDRLKLTLDKKVQGWVLSSARKGLAAGAWAARRSLNDSIRTHYALKMAELNYNREPNKKTDTEETPSPSKPKRAKETGWLKLFKKLGGRLLVNMSAGVEVRNGPVSLIRFVKGKAQPVSIQGKKRTTPRPVRLMIHPGKLDIRKHGLFIAKGKNNNVQVFSRGARKFGHKFKKGERKSRLIKQAAPSPHIVVEKNKQWTDEAGKKAGVTFMVEFTRMLERLLAKANK
jgi:hypothetical protein